MDPPRPSYAALVASQLMTVVLIGAIAFGVLMTADALTGDPLDVVFHADAPIDDDALPKGVRASDDQGTGIAIENPTMRERHLALAANLVPLLLVIAVLWLLRSIARSVRDGDPFVDDNVRRLRAIGFLLTIGIVVVHFVTQALDDALADPYLLSGLEAIAASERWPLDEDWQPVALLSGLGAFILAQVFAHGVRLREDVEATI